ncbi:MAG TPA: hypothetical protein VH558_06970 [Pseudolabrys sp.]|jgi:hypothetical protein
MLLPLEPLVDVALDPVVDVALEPVTGVLGATGALLGAVLPMDLLGRLTSPSGVTFGTAPGLSGRKAGRRAAALPSDRSRARHSRMYLALCLPV